MERKFSAKYSVVAVLALLFAPVLAQAQNPLSKILDAVGGGVQNLGDKLIKPNAPEDGVSMKDPLCDTLDEAYRVTDNVGSIAGIAAGKALQDLLKGKSNAAGKDQLEDHVKEVSKQYVWVPVMLETQIGNNAHAQQEAANNILRRDAGKNAKLYDKAEQALATARQEYTKMPYEIRLFVITGDVINAQALPGGIIYVTRKSVMELDDSALQVVLGHELAHVAKRHTSKQLQQRLIETGVATDLFKQLINVRGQADPGGTLTSASTIVQKLRGVFARYDQQQELQADACSVRAMVNADIDPLAAREEYLRKRGPVVASAGGATPNSSGSAGLGFTEHPENKERDQFYRNAAQHHLAKKAGNAKAGN